MAKKKKKSGRGPGRPRKEEAEAAKKQSFFWRQIYAFVLILLAILLLVGGLGWGGALPVKLFYIFSIFCEYLYSVILSVNCRSFSEGSKRRIQGNYKKYSISGFFTHYVRSE